MCDALTGCFLRRPSAQELMERKIRVTLWLHKPAPRLASCRVCRVLIFPIPGNPNPPRCSVVVLTSASTADLRSAFWPSVHCQDPSPSDCPPALPGGPIQPTPQQASRAHASSPVSVPLMSRSGCLFQKTPNNSSSDTWFLCRRPGVWRRLSARPAGSVASEAQAPPAAARRLRHLIIQQSCSGTSLAPAFQPAGRRKGKARSSLQRPSPGAVHTHRPRSSHRLESSPSSHRGGWGLHR